MGFQAKYDILPTKATRYTRVRQEIGHNAVVRESGLWMRPVTQPEQGWYSGKKYRNGRIGSPKQNEKIQAIQIGFLYSDNSGLKRSLTPSRTARLNHRSPKR